MVGLFVGPGVGESVNGAFVGELMGASVGALVGSVGGVGEPVVGDKVGKEGEFVGNCVGESEVPAGKHRANICARVSVPTHKG